ncbi:class I SAM-dependent methyltransferase [Methylomonas sp. 2BW1-5-20]|uniref:class I SAM-dependent methyltransferase n=1 Tax=Methylomonas sp. 2BW1-5-20 TaxID=3376686 RepID=UPI0040514D4C
MNISKVTEQAQAINHIKQKYYSQLKTLNPDIESIYSSARNYYNAEILPLLPQNKNANILDIGCGFGHLLRFLIENHYKSVGGVELDENVFLECRNHIGEQATFLENIDAQIFLKGSANKFETVIATDVIEHFSMHELIEFLGLIRTSLSSEGIIILRTPNMANIFGTYSRYMDLTHQTGFTEQSLSELLSVAGFTNPTLHLPNWKHHPNGLKFRCSSLIQKSLFSLQDRSKPRCFDKNIVMWATK